MRNIRMIPCAFFLELEKIKALNAAVTLVFATYLRRRVSLPFGLIYWTV